MTPKKIELSNISCGGITEILIEGKRYKLELREADAINTEPEPTLCNCECHHA